MDPVTHVWSRNLIPNPEVAGGWADLKLAIDYTLADAAVLYTVPAGLRLLIQDAWWDIVTGFTGGSSSAVGLSSSQAPYTTKGMLLGGSSGDVAATLVAGATQGTVGTGLTAAPKLIVLAAGATVRFDRITSVFTAGAGYVHLTAQLIN